MSTPRVRIAPSPTGYLHIGTARAALFNYLFAHHHRGTFVLRIEDTDLERSEKKYEESIFEDLRWLGIDPDEGLEQGGSYAPYRQTERTETYIKYIDDLFKNGFAFYCFHTEEELENERKELARAKHPQLHLCEYRTMELSQAEELAAINKNHVIRFKTPVGKKITFHDMIRGEISFESDLLGDFSIARRRDTPLYHFAVVVDDITMEISHVIRGEDHIPNTPKHILLFKALGASVPQFAHLPLILGQDRSKLSKRHGATSIAESERLGYLPDALFNFIALLGWNPGTDQEIFTKEELIQLFDIEKVQKSGAIFDFQKLDWMNGEYIRKKSIAELTELCIPFLHEKTGIKLPSRKFPRTYLEQIVALEQPRLKRLSEIGEKTVYFFQKPEYPPSLLAWKKMSATELYVSLADADRLLAQLPEKPNISESERIFFDAIGAGDKGSMLWPLRIALTGMKASPGPFEIISVLGAKEARARIHYAQKLLKNVV
ncbi:MAG: nondiscriminating glutamyl-tRNA synthetase [Parcubacteria group bacterium Gr01-1014_66]|nr:MAG: nondiscriminating glutamyl-tRNA synthetase [Parcubacteria group bacterium Gr01-1014_66]